MQNRKCFGIRTFAIVLGFLSITNASDYFTDKGSVWLTGSFGFSTIGIEGQNDRMNVILVTPTARFFPVPFFALGPRFQWIGIFDNDDSQNQIGFGMDLAFAYGKNSSFIPYVRSGGQFDIYSYSYSGSAYYSGSSTSETGFTLPIAVGMLTKVNGIFGLHFEPSFQIRWVDGESMNVFSFSFGFGGIGDKICVTTLQSLSSFY
jgi:hypothetical protein